MRRSDFFYQLPPELIAREALEPRSASRLLHLGGEGLQHLRMMDLPSLLKPADLMIFNDTRVIKARFRAVKPTGGKVELLVERVLSDQEVLAQMAASKKPKAGGFIELADGRFEMLGRQDDLFHLRWHGTGTIWQLMETVGELPLPHYFERAARSDDEHRYQSLFAEKPGAVAAPTASLHFDAELLSALASHGIATATVTLHVGAGTFQPVRVEELQQHQMHSERFSVPARTVEQINATRASGGRVIAVGTTVARALESAYDAPGALAPARSEGETRLFITPGYRFKMVDLLLTNFHLPESTLLMLVSAFGGFERLKSAYQAAIENRYRFFSYGDAMLIEPQPGSG